MVVHTATGEAIGNPAHYGNQYRRHFGDLSEGMPVEAQSVDRSDLGYIRTISTDASSVIFQPENSSEQDAPSLPGRIVTAREVALGKVMFHEHPQQPLPGLDEFSRIPNARPKDRTHTEAVKVAYRLEDRRSRVAQMSFFKMFRPGHGPEGLIINV